MIIGRIIIILIFVAIFGFFRNSRLLVSDPMFFRGSFHLSSKRSLVLVPAPHHKDNNDNSGKKEGDGEGGDDDQDSWRPWWEKGSIEFSI